MTCEQFERILLTPDHPVGDRNSSLSGSRATLVEEHVRNCPACAMKLAEADKLEDALEQLRLSTMHVRASTAMESTLLEAFRRNSAKRRSSADRALWNLVWISATAVVLLAAGILFYSKLHLRSHTAVESDRRAKQDIQAQFPPSRPSPPVELFSQNHIAEKAVISSRRHIRRTGKPIHELEGSGAPVVPTDELSLNGGGSIVRVTLPFSSLTAMGLPVRPDITDSRVTADVWMDPFGAVVGIRLVPAKVNAN